MAFYDMLCHSSTLEGVKTKKPERARGGTELSSGNDLLIKHLPSAQEREKCQLDEDEE